MKSLYLVLVVLIFASCNEEYVTGKKDASGSSKELRIVEVGGCEYVFYRPMLNSGGAAIVHHGACKNHKPIWLVSKDTLEDWMGNGNHGNGIRLLIPESQEINIDSATNSK